MGSLWSNQLISYILLPGKRSTIAQATAAGLLQIPSSTVPVVDLTEEDTNTAQGNLTTGSYSK